MDFSGEPRIVNKNRFTKKHYKSKDMIARLNNESI